MVTTRRQKTETTGDFQAIDISSSSRTRQQRVLTVRAHKEREERKQDAPDASESLQRTDESIGSLPELVALVCSGIVAGLIMVIFGLPA
jgi:hypothetical protein